MILAGCSFFQIYRPTIQQGNIISDNAVAQIKPGMTPTQVAYLMGTPVLSDTFSPNRWDYVYTYKKGNAPRQQRYVTVFFANGIVQSVQTTPLITLQGS